MRASAISIGASSNTLASACRQPVSRVHPRSANRSPRDRSSFKTAIAPFGFFAVSESTTILSASGNSGSKYRVEKNRAPRHHSTTGRSGTISGSSRLRDFAQIRRVGRSSRSLPSRSADALPNGIQHSAKTRASSSAPSRGLQNNRAAGMIVHQHAQRLPDLLRVAFVLRDHQQVMAQARSTPPDSCSRASCSHRSRRSCRTFSGWIHRSRRSRRSSTVCPLPRQHRVRFRRPPRPRLVIRKIEFATVPVFQNRLHRPPARLHHVLPRV